jgi:hypothetical protein
MAGHELAVITITIAAARPLNNENIEIPRTRPAPEL